MNLKGDLLIVDETPDNVGALVAGLTQQGYNVRCLTSGALALAAVQADCPDLILLASQLPDLDSYQVCMHLKVDPPNVSYPCHLFRYP